MKTSVPRLKVMHLVHAFRLGGMENGISNLCHQHEGHGIQHEICSLTDSDDFKLRLPKSVPLFELNKAPGFSVSTLLQLKRLVEIRQPQLLHAHNYVGMIYGGLVALATGIPLCLGEHASLRSWEKAAWRLALRRFLYQHFLGGAHAVSKDLAREISQQLFDQDFHPKMRALVNGVDTMKFQPKNISEAKQALGLDPELRCVGISARLAKSKGHDFLLRVFQSLRDVGDKVQLLIVGSAASEEAASILSTVEAHPDRAFIHYLGSRSDMPEIYPAMDVMVLPSTSEGLSNACLEAMSCGVPVVCSESAGAYELIPDPRLGTVVPEFEVLDWAFEIRKVLAKSELQPAWKMEIRQHVETYFGMASMAKQYADMYQQMVEHAWQMKPLSK